MYNTLDLVNCIKNISKSVFMNEEPTTVIIGEVVGVDPIKIKIDQLLTLSKEQLIIPKSLTDYTLDIDIKELNTENKSVTLGEYTNTHNHAIRGKKTITILNALKLGELVLLIKLLGGQSFIVLDRLERDAT